MLGTRRLHRARSGLVRAASRVGAPACVLASVLACASTSGGGAGAASGQQAPSYQRNVGVASSTDLVNKGRLVLSRHSYNILRQQPPPDIYLESEWRRRSPFSDEREQGVEVAQSRVIVRGRLRSGGGGARVGDPGELYSVDITVENQVQRNGTWGQMPMSTMFAAHAKQVADDLEMEFRSGVRRY